MIPVRKIFNILEQMNEKDTEELARNNHPENENEGEGSHINISGKSFFFYNHNIYIYFFFFFFFFFFFLPFFNNCIINYNDLSN